MYWNSKARPLLASMLNSTEQRGAHHSPLPIKALKAVYLVPTAIQPASKHPPTPYPTIGQPYPLRYNCIQGSPKTPMKILHVIIAAGIVITTALLVALIQSGGAVAVRSVPPTDEMHVVGQLLQAYTEDYKRIDDASKPSREAIAELEAEMRMRMEPFETELEPLEEAMDKIAEKAAGLHYTLCQMGVRYVSGTKGGTFVAIDEPCRPLE